MKRKYCFSKAQIEGKRYKINSISSSLWFYEKEVLKNPNSPVPTLNNLIAANLLEYSLNTTTINLSQVFYGSGWFVPRAKKYIEKGYLKCPKTRNWWFNALKPINWTIFYVNMKENVFF